MGKEKERVSLHDTPCRAAPHRNSACFASHHQSSWKCVAQYGHRLGSWQQPWTMPKPLTPRQSHPHHVKATDTKLKPPTLCQNHPHRAKATAATTSCRQRVVLPQRETTRKAHVELIKIFLTKPLPESNYLICICIYISFFLSKEHIALWETSCFQGVMQMEPEKPKLCREMLLVLAQTMNYV